MIDPNFPPILEEIGQIALSAAEDESEKDRVLIIAEAERAYQHVGLFFDAGDAVINQDFPHELDKAVERLWEAAAPDKKWQMLIYEIIDGRFTVEFLYPNDIDPEEDEDDRHDRIIDERFGNKKLVNRGWPEFFDDISEDDLTPHDD
jgi:hypothetical protein